MNPRLLTNSCCNLKRAALVLLILSLFTHTPTQVGAAQQSDEKQQGPKIAVIGGAISGSFVTKYLVDYDVDCTVIESITIFEPVPLTEPIDVSAQTHPDDNDWQATRVQSLRLQDGTIVELGASIGFKEFHLVKEMIQNDPQLEMGRPFHTGTLSEKQEEAHKNNLHKGMGIYSGSGEWHLLTSNYKSSFVNNLILLWRYLWDLMAINYICKTFVERFAKLPSLLISNAPDSFFTSPEKVWQSIGLAEAAHVSFDALLDSLNIPAELPTWRYWLLPYQGSLRKELLTAINLVNYNQDNAHVNGIVGLGSFAASSGGLFSIVGGNVKIIGSAMKQARARRQEYCKDNVVRMMSIIEIPKKVTSCIGSMEGLSLFSDQEDLGTFDIVILAAPLQQSRIDFFIQSSMDPAVLQPMPMGALVQPNEDQAEIDKHHEGHVLLPNKLLDSAIRPYTQVVTTVVSHATLSAAFFGMDDESSMPRSVLMTSAGKENVYNITAITQLTSSSSIGGGVYKMFSNDKLSTDVLTRLFGNGHVVEYVKLWGGPYGGATPDYQGQGDAVDFLLYDGAVGVQGHTKSGALFYPNAMEQSSLACMEISAVGASAVAKLIARRLGLVEVATAADNARTDEL